MTNQLKEKLLAYGTKAEPFTVHNHIRVTDLQDGEARVELTLQPESLNRWGTAHGGILFALADIAAGTAVLTPCGRKCASLSTPPSTFWMRRGWAAPSSPWATWIAWASLSASATRTSPTRRAACWRRCGR